MSCSRRRSSRSGSRLRRDGVQLVGVISRAPSYRGRHMANPETTNAPVGGGAFASVRQQYRIMASCSPIQMDVKPVGADSRYRIHTHCSSPQRGHLMIGCAARCRVARHREAAIIGTLHQDEFGLHHRSSGISKFPANSLLFVENSLLGVQKFPAPLRREFGCKPMDSLAEWRRKLANEPKIFKNSLQIPC